MLKEKLLREFEQNRGTPLSGQDLADKYHVSRNAVWKAVNMLKKEGWPVMVQGKKGYLFADESDFLSEEAVSSCLSSSSPDTILVFREIDSTNAEARRMLTAGFCGSALILSDRQTRGVGHSQKAFYSPSGTGLYMTLLLPVSLGSSDLCHVGKAAAVCVIRAVTRLTGKQPFIQRTSDIFLDGKKVGGILCEAFSSDLESGLFRSLCIGIGLNVTTRDFPEDLEDTCTSLGGGCTRNRLAAEITGKLLEMDFADSGSFLPDYEKFRASR